jgi:subtilase family serine protease
VSIANRGTDPAGPFKVKVYIGRDVTLVGAQLVGTQSVSGLGAGQSATLSFTNLRFGGLAVHIWYTLTVVIDADTQVQESNENNNTFATSFYAM